jgi:ABC-type uncharacterized transport system substrate-binding protein
MLSAHTVGFLAEAAPRLSPVSGAFASELRRDPFGSGAEVICGYAGSGECYVAMARDLLQRGAEVIVAANTMAARAASALTDQIPIVMLTGGDPAHTGLRADNVVAMCRSSADLAPDRVRWVRWAFASADRIGVIWNPRSPAKMMEYDAVAAAAGHDAVQDLAVVSPEQIEARFAQLDADALIVLGDSLTGQHRDLIIRLAAEYGVPAMYWAPDIVESGGLLCYGPDRFDACRHAATYVAQILAGDRLRDLAIAPIQPELVVNRLTELHDPRFRINPAVRDRARLVA